MNQDQNRQIMQMIRFIQQEATEKAEEILTKAASELNGTKRTLLNKREDELRVAFEKKAEDVQIEKKIARSRKFGESKIRTMRFRDEKMSEVRAEVLKQLLSAASMEQYAELMAQLIVEGLLSMQEKKVTVQFREMDKDVALAAIPKAKAQFEEIFQKAVGQPISVTLTPSDEYLPGPPSEGKLGCTGGVTLSANGRQMILRNTLDKRLDIAFDRLKPSLRSLLFGERAPPERSDFDDEEHGGKAVAGAE
jgi:V-type H+-transporting ATPase subunit E